MLNTHRAEMNNAILATGGTVMQYVGDAVMAVFGAPFPQDDHARRALQAACAMHERQETVNDKWRADGLPEFGLGIGLSTGEVAAALLGSDERLEYTLVGDTVNLAQRLQDLARPPGTVLSGATLEALPDAPAVTPLDAEFVKGRETPVVAYRLTEIESGTDGQQGKECGMENVCTVWGSARRSRPSSRRCARCAASTSTSRPASSSR